MTRRGRLAGVFFPWRDSTLPVEIGRELFTALSAELQRQVKKRGLAEQEVLGGFESWRKERRATRRRR